jgi:hypothetical protein
MKSTIISTARIVIAILLTGKMAFGQFTNLQVHKEMGSISVNDSVKIKRDGIKAKFEMLGFDSLGIYYWNTSTLYSTKDKSVSAQLQILRGISISKHSRFQILVGHQSATGTTSQYYLGIHHPLKLGRVKFLPFLAYVYNKDQRSADFRFTSGVSTLLAKKKIIIFGFVNAYTKDKFTPEAQPTKEIGFQANPQVWFRFNKQIAAGGELGLDYLGSRYQKFITIPTAGFRWNF